MNSKGRLLVGSLLTTSLLASSFMPCFAQYNNYNNKPYSNYNQNYNQSFNNYSMPSLKGQVVTIPMGTSLNAVTHTALSSETLTVGDTVSVSLANDFYYNGVLVLPANTSVQGNVVLAQKAGLAGKAGQLKIKFTNAITPSGQRVPLSGKLATQSGDGLLTGGTTTGRLTSAAKQGAVGAGLGALVGTFMGPLSGGKVGKGAIYGTAVGGGLGLGKSVIDKGNDATIPAGSSVDIIIDSPTSVNLNQGYNY